MSDFDMNAFGSGSKKIKPKRDVEREAAADLSDFANRSKAEQERFKAATNTHYYFCAVFASEADRDTFLRGVGIEPDGRFISGYTLAEAVGKPLERKTPPIKLRDRRKPHA